MSDGSTFSMTGEDAAPSLWGYGRPYAKGKQLGIILFAKADKWPNSNDRYIEVTFGISCPAGSDFAGMGCKVDRRFSVPSDDWRAFLSIVEPAALQVAKGVQYNIDFAKWKGRNMLLTVTEEKDKKRSEEAGQPVMRPRIGGYESAPAPAAQKGGPL